MLRALARGTLSDEESDTSTEQDTLQHTELSSLPSVSSLNLSSPSRSTQDGSTGSSEDDSLPHRTQSEYDEQWIDQLCSVVNAHITETASYDVYSKWSAIQTLLKTYHSNTTQLVRDADKDHLTVTQLRSDVMHYKLLIQRVERVLFTARAAYEQING